MVERIEHATSTTVFLDPIWRMDVGCSGRGAVVLVGELCTQRDSFAIYPACVHGYGVAFPVTYRHANGLGDPFPGADCYIHPSSDGYTDLHACANGDAVADGAPCLDR